MAHSIKATIDEANRAPDAETATRVALTGILVCMGQDPAASRSDVYRDLQTNDAALYSAMTDPTPPPPPENDEVPYLSGTGAVGQTLACTMGVWLGEPTKYEYQWMRDAVANGAPTAGNTYIVTADDVGHDVTCVVIAENASGSAEAPPSNQVQVR